MADIPSIPPGVTLTTLPNGLEIIVREDHSAPVVSAQAWCRTGSIHEDRWLGAGLSHVLEHMLFKGTATRGAGRIDQEVQAAGGYMNAYTSFDRTVYYINAPNTGATVAIDILCDIMQNATLPAGELAKELDVIRREMDMGQDDPSRRSSKRLFETAYRQSPYRYPIIGIPDIFNRLEAGDIRDYYRQRYVPNNIFFVIVGDVNGATVVEQIRRAFAESKACALAPVVLPAEQPQSGAREVIEQDAVELVHLHYAWHVPSLHHPDMPALDVLSTLLGNGRSSRLYREVRERKGLVVHADAWTYSPGNSGIAGVSAVVEPGKFDEARNALLAEIERMQAHAASAEELQKAVKQFLAATLATRKTMQGQAQDLGGNWLTAHDLNFSERYLEAVRRVTPGDVQRVAGQYFTHANGTLYALLPEGVRSTSHQVVEVCEESRPIRRIELANGLRVLLKEDHRLPFVEFRAVFQGGVLAETEASNGISQIMTRTLLKGTLKRDAETIAFEIESVGGSVDTYSGNNSFGVNVEVMRDEFALGLDLLSDLILHPVFPEHAIARELDVQLAGLQAQRDQLLPSCMRLMRRSMYGRQSYGLDVLGLEESVRSLKATDVRAFHQRLSVPGNCVLSVFGDIDPERVQKALENAFGDWQGRANVAFPPVFLERQMNGGRAVEHRDKKQAVLVVGFPGATLMSEDRFALELISEACSDLGSRLFMRIRDELGLAYYVGAQNFPGLQPGYFAFYVGTDPAKLEMVERELLAEAASLRARGLTDEELHRSKAKLIGQKKIARQELGALAMQSALDELYGLGFNRSAADDARFEAVTLEEIQEVAARCFDPAAAVIAAIRPAGWPA